MWSTALAHTYMKWIVCFSRCLSSFVIFIFREQTHILSFALDALNTTCATHRCRSLFRITQYFQLVVRDVVYLSLFFSVCACAMCIKLNAILDCFDGLCVGSIINGRICRDLCVQQRLVWIILMGYSFQHKKHRLEREVL